MAVINDEVLHYGKPSWERPAKSLKIRSDQNSEIIRVAGNNEFLAREFLTVVVSDSDEVFKTVMMKYLKQ